MKVCRGKADDADDGYCHSERIATLRIELGSINWKVGQLGATVGDFWMDDFGIGHEDNILTLEICLDCGRLQGSYPRPLTLLERKQAELAAVAS